MTSDGGAAGPAALKLDANKIAETESRAMESVIWSAEARAELFFGFFIGISFAVRGVCAASETPLYEAGFIRVNNKSKRFSAN